MHFFIWLFSLLTTTCLAADSSCKQTSDRDFNSENCQQKEAELETLSKMLDKHLTFDRNYFANLESKKVSIEAASLMSFIELNDLESSSEAAVIKAQNEGALCERNIHMANSDLAKFFKMDKPLNIQQATFDAWMNSGFSGINFMAGMPKAGLRGRCRPFEIFCRPPASLHSTNTLIP